MSNFNQKSEKDFPCPTLTQLDRENRETKKREINFGLKASKNLILPI